MARDIVLRIQRKYFVPHDDSDDVTVRLLRNCEKKCTGELHIQYDHSDCTFSVYSTVLLHRFHLPQSIVKVVTVLDANSFIYFNTGNHNNVDK